MKILVHGRPIVVCPVFASVKNGDKVTLRALIQKKAHVNAAEPDGSTPLH